MHGKRCSLLPNIVVLDPCLRGDDSGGTSYNNGLLSEAIAVSAAAMLYAAFVLTLLSAIRLSF